jgi:hypothetical protein
LNVSIALYDPNSAILTGSTINRTPFPNNVIPAYLLKEGGNINKSLRLLSGQSAPPGFKIQWMSSRRTRRARRQPNQGNASAENSPQAARIDALLDPVRKMDLAGIEDERARAIVALLLNLVEDLGRELKKAHQEIAYLRQRLGLGRGGGGEPDGQSESTPAQQPHSPEKERKEAPRTS